LLGGVLVPRRKLILRSRRKLDKKKKRNSKKETGRKRGVQVQKFRGRPEQPSKIGKGGCEL